MIQRSNGQASFFVQERTSDLVRRLQGGKPLLSLRDLSDPTPASPRTQSPVELHVGGEVYKGRVTGIETDPNKELSITCEFPEEY